MSQRPHAPFTCGPAHWLLLLLWAIGCSWGMNAQRSDMKVLGRQRLIELPFALENDFIVVAVLLNNKIPLRFIVDTGAENTVLLDRKLTDALDITYRRTFEVRGADVTTKMTAHLATGVDLQLADRLLARNRTVLVLDENYFNFERITGTNIHGILGGDFLMRFVVELDFRRQVITLHDPSKFRRRRQYVEVPATFIRNRPYLNVPVGVLQDSVTVRKLLMDTGASLGLLIHTHPDQERQDLPAQTIPAHIASGLGGTMLGSVGRTRMVDFGDRRMDGVVTYFQEVDTAEMKFLNRREGILGNRILKRFSVVIDYVGQRVYVRADGRQVRRKFTYDRSGLTVLAGGDNLRKFSIANVVPGSPADRAGLRVSDRLRAINGISTGLLSLENIVRKLEGKAGRRVRLRIYRAGRLYDYDFTLEDLI